MTAQLGDNNQSSHLFGILTNRLEVETEVVINVDHIIEILYL